jgi:hypothetical protein
MKKENYFFTSVPLHEGWFVIEIQVPKFLRRAKTNLPQTSNLQQRGVRVIRAIRAKKK